MLRLFLSLILATSLFSVSFAKDLTFEEAKESALKNSRLIKAYNEKLKAAEFRKNKAFGSYSPQINFVHRYVDTDEPANAAFSMMAQGRFDMAYFMNQLSDPERQRNHMSKIELIQPVFMQGKIFFGIKQAKKAFAAQGHEAEFVKQSVVYNLYRAFYGLALAQRAVNVMEYSLKRTKDYYGKTEEFFNNGLIVKSDLLVAESYLLKVEEALQEALKNRAVAESRLQMLLDADEDLKALCSVWKAELTETIDQFTADALKNRADLKAAEYMTEIARLERSKSRAAYGPELALFADYTRNDEKMFGKNGEGTTFGVNFKLNLFDGLKTYSGSKEAESMYLAALHEFANMKLQVKTEVKESYYTVETAKKRVDYAKKRLQSAGSALEITKNRFDEGLSRVTELLDREIEYQQSELSVCASEYELITARAALLYASGLLK